MFKVKHKYLDREEEVCAARKDIWTDRDGFNYEDTEFLIFTGTKWDWVSANDYSPA